METKIYVMTHKEIEVFSDPMYQVLHVKLKKEKILQIKIVTIVNLLECIGFGKMCRM